MPGGAKEDLGRGNIHWATGDRLIAHGNVMPNQNCGAGAVVRVRDLVRRFDAVYRWPVRA